VAPFDDGAPAGFDELLAAAAPLPSVDPFFLAGGAAVLPVFGISCSPVIPQFSEMEPFL